MEGEWEANSPHACRLSCQCNLLTSSPSQWSGAGKPTATEHDCGGKSPGSRSVASVSSFACPMSSSQVLRKAVAPDHAKQKPAQGTSKVTQPRSQAMSLRPSQSKSHDVDVQVSLVSCVCVATGQLIMEMEEVASGGNRKPLPSEPGAHAPANPRKMHRSLSTSSQSLDPGHVSIATREVFPAKDSRAANHRTEQQVGDILFRGPTQNELQHTENLERPDTELPESVNKIEQLEDAPANGKSQVAAKPSAMPFEGHNIDQLQKVISGWEATCNKQAEELRQAQRGKDALMHRIGQKDQTIDKLKKRFNHEKEAMAREISDFRKDNQSLTTSVTNKDKSIRQLKNDMAALRKDAEQHHEERVKAAAENEKLRAHIEQQELSVTKAQNAAMNVLSRSLSAALPDDRIRARFEELFESVAEWARDNATEDRTILQHTDNQLKWQQSGIVRWVAEPGPQPYSKFDLGDETAIDTLLNTALARRFCQDFLGNPFWFAQDSRPFMDTTAAETERIDTDVAIERLLKKMMICECPSNRVRKFPKTDTS
jgi:predicted  nucleic acid-binding Zn-ribbon protein